MLTLDEKTRLGNDGRFIHLVKSAMIGKASDVIHEKVHELSFGDIQDAALAELPAVKLAQQQAAHAKRAAMAQKILESDATINDGARRAAKMLASRMAEDVAKENPQAGALCAALMVELLESKVKETTTTYIDTDEVDEFGEPIQEAIVNVPEWWEALGLLEPAKQAQLDAFIELTIAEGWSAASGFNVHHEIPKAIAGV